MTHYQRVWQTAGRTDARDGRESAEFIIAELVSDSAADEYEVGFERFLVFAESGLWDDEEPIETWRDRV